MCPLFFSPGSDEDAAELSQNLPPTPQKEPEKEGEDVELKKQQMLVQYLKDTETFALQVERAISVINTMLYWKTTSGTRWSHGPVYTVSLLDIYHMKCVCFSGPGGCAVLCDGV